MPTTPPTTPTPTPTPTPKADYGVDAPGVLRNLFLFGGVCLAAALLGPARFRVGPLQFTGLRSALLITGAFLVAEGLLYLIYVKVGKLRHRDFILGLHSWRGEEQVLDVGCGRGLLLAGAAQRLTTGHATGIDVWSSVDMADNTEAATLRNLSIEGIADRCTLVSQPAQDMAFPDASFDVVLSNLCLHNIYDTAARRRAVEQIVRVLKPGGEALISDYKRTGEYARQLRRAGLRVSRRWGNAWATFPPLPVVIARKP